MIEYSRYDLDHTPVVDRDPLMHVKFRLFIKLWAVIAIHLACMANTSFASSQEKPDSNSRDLLRKTIASSSSFKDRFEAEVWLVDMSARLKKLAPHIPKQERYSILRYVHQEATRHSLNPQLVLSLIQVESYFDKFAISSAGARGLMQIMPFWVKEIGHPNDNLFDIATNIKYGCAILSHYLQRENKRLTEGLARYNGSIGKTWYPDRVFKAWQKKWFVKNY